MWSGFQAVLQQLKPFYKPFNPGAFIGGYGHLPSDGQLSSKPASVQPSRTTSTIGLWCAVFCCDCRTFNGISNQRCYCRSISSWSCTSAATGFLPTAKLALLQPLQLVQAVGAPDSEELLAKPFLVPRQPALSSVLIEEIAEQVLLVIQRYGQHTTESTSDIGEAWKGRALFLPKILRCIERSDIISMILPAFPWKSINTATKVLGKLPDLGETLALARLNQLCHDIEAVYWPGAKITIATDGVVFDDVVGISNEDTWAYGEELQKIVNDRGFKNIQLRRPMELLGLVSKAKLNKERYMQLCSPTREKLLHDFGQSEAEVRQMMQIDPDTLMTYCGFIRFLETDLRYSEIAAEAQSGSQYRKKVKKVAINMMIRAESFTKFLQATFPEHVRLSIHPSSGAAKLSVPLIVQANGQFPRAPWHCCIAVGVDGSYRTCHAVDVRETHRLIMYNNRPHFYRERSPLWDWETDDVVFEPQYPHGLLVRPRAFGPGKPELKLLDVARANKLVALAESFGGNVEARGFANCGHPFVK